VLLRRSTLTATEIAYIHVKKKIGCEKLQPAPAPEADGDAYQDGNCDTDHNFYKNSAPYGISGK